MRMFIIFLAEIMQTEAAVLARAAVETLIALGRSYVVAVIALLL
jgi:hypothetical protein